MSLALLYSLSSEDLSMTRIKRLVSTIVLLATIITLFIPVTAHAASYSYSQNTAAVFTIKTGSSSAKLKFSQTKGQYKYLYLTGLGTYNTVSTYGCYFIYVQDVSSGSATTYNVYVTSGKTITLAKNKTYRVTVCASSREVTFNQLKAKGVLPLAAFNCNYLSSYWATPTRWTANISSAKSVAVSTYNAPQQ